MRKLYTIVLKGKEGQVLTHGKRTLRANQPIYAYDEIPSDLQPLIDSGVLSYSVKEIDETKKESLPSKKGVVYVGRDYEISLAYLGISGLFVRNVPRWDLSQEDIEKIQTLGKDFKIIEKEVNIEEVKK